PHLRAGRTAGGAARAADAAVVAGGVAGKFSRVREEAGQDQVLTESKKDKVRRKKFGLSHHFVNRPSYFLLQFHFANISNSSFSSSFTLTVPPAMEIGLMPKALCFKLAAPRQCPLAICWTLASIGRVWPRNVRSPATRRSA